MRQKQFSSFDVAAVVYELQGSILDSRVINVYQLGARTLLLKLRKADMPVFWLILESGRRLHLTSYTVEKPKFPPAFCMALRKYLRNSRLTGVEQHEFERIVVFTFRTKTGLMQLFLELFGDGNIILVGETGKILHALSYKRMRDRNVLRGEVFRLAPSNRKNPLKVSSEELLEEIRNSGDVEVVRALAGFLGVGGFYAEETLLRAGVPKEKPCNVLSDSMVDAIFAELRGLLSQVISGELKPHIVLNETGGFVDAAPVELRRYIRLNHQSYGSFNEALDEFHVKVNAIERALGAAVGDVEGLNREAGRLRRIIESQRNVLVEAKTEAEENKCVGDVIYTNGSDLQALLERFLAGKTEGKEWREVISEILAEKEAGLRPGVLFESFDSKRLVVNVCVDDLRFSLSLRRSLFDNAARFYERSKRAKRRLRGATEALEETHKKLAKAETKIRATEVLQKVKPDEVLGELIERKIKRREWFEKFRWFVSSDGFLVVAGKDAVSNEVLVKKYTGHDDVVFHADVAGAPFVVVKTDGRTSSEKVLQEASEFSAAFSRGWREGFASVDVYWVRPDQLSKGGGSGEYVPRGAFVVRGRRNWLRGVSLRLAVGILVEDGEVMFVGGPVDAVAAKTKKYVVVVPGNLDSKVFPRHIFKNLAGKIPKGMREKVLKTSVEEIRPFIPYSKCRVLED